MENSLEIKKSVKSKSEREIEFKREKKAFSVRESGNIIRK